MQQCHDNSTEGSQSNYGGLQCPPTGQEGLPWIGRDEKKRTKDTGIGKKTNSSNVFTPPQIRGGD